MELPSFLRVWQFVAIARWSVYNHTCSRPNGSLQFRSKTLSLRSAMASIVGCFITWCFIAKEDTISALALPVLGKFCFNCENMPLKSDKVNVGPMSCLMMHVFPAEKRIFQMSDFQEYGFLFGTLLSTNNSIYYEELNFEVSTELAQKCERYWLNVFSGTGLFNGKPIQRNLSVWQWLNSIIRTKW